jgi:hypothetical protein
VLECWSAGVLEGWRAGVLEGWRAGGLESKLLGVNILVVHNYVSFNGSHNQDVFVRAGRCTGNGWNLLPETTSSVQLVSTIPAVR